MAVIDVDEEAAIMGAVEEDSELKGANCDWKRPGSRE